MMDLLNTYMRFAYKNALYKGPPTPVDTSKGDKPQKEMGFLNEIMEMSGGSEAPAGTTTVGGKSYAPGAAPKYGGYGGTSDVYGFKQYGGNSPASSYGKTGFRNDQQGQQGVSRSIGNTVFTPGMSAGYTRPAGTTVSGGQSHKPFG